jgi:hypothetical protein
MFRNLVKLDESNKDCKSKHVITRLDKNGNQNHRHSHLVQSGPKPLLYTSSSSSFPPQDPGGDVKHFESQEEDY